MKLFRKIGGLGYRLALPIFDPIQLIKVVPWYLFFFIDLARYNYRVLSKNTKRATFIDLQPALGDRTSVTRIDPAYFYQGVWTFEKVLKSGMQHHVDVASQTDLAAYLSKVIRVTFVDIRPLRVKLDNFESIKGTVTELPFNNDSTHSISCLHVVEHIGLGRYGDQLDPDGTMKAFKELKRVLEPGGNLYLSLPIGRERVCFNAHRVTSPKTILDFFSDLEVMDIRCIRDDGSVDENPNLVSYENAIYSMGFFHFRKPSA